MNRQRRPIAALSIGFLSFALAAFTWPWDLSGGWPSSSSEPVTPLERPLLEDVLPDSVDSVRFAAFGDQRALADGEWQEMLVAINRLRERAPLDFIIDTGDIVEDGGHSDQFVFLRDLLEPVADLPYLVSVGNHETRNNTDPIARIQTGTFLARVDPAFSPDRYYFRKDAGACRVLFLDTNDLVYGDLGEGLGLEEPVAGSRGELQMRWIRSQLSHQEPPGTYTIVVLHHPLVQSSAKHRDQAVQLWEYGDRGRKLRDLFVAGGVDLILTGHTHTYERFLLEKGASRMHLVNLSGRPRTSFLWVGDGDRRPKDVRGEESTWFPEKGWRMDGWKFEQRAVMLGDEEDQFAVFEIDGAGPPRMSVYLLDEDEPSGIRLFESVVLE